MKYLLPKLATGLLLLERSLGTKGLYAIFFYSEGVGKRQVSIELKCPNL
jgi:hypothetical protein